MDWYHVRAVSYWLMRGNRLRHVQGVLFVSKVRSTHLVNNIHVVSKRPSVNHNLREVATRADMTNSGS